MILTESKIRQAAKETKEQRILIQESVTHFDSAITYDLFISHSFNDSELVAGLYHLFNKAGYTVYIDWIDDNKLDRKKVTSETAGLIRERINSSKGTAYISTTNSIASKWCPWELGVADGLIGRVCILPIMNCPFNGQEYLGLYPYLEYEKVKGKERYEFWVYDQSDRGKYTILRSWLMGEQPYYHKR